jgi:limonene-1,2-epoxide hydrolase
MDRRTFVSGAAGAAVAAKAAAAAVLAVAAPGGAEAATPSKAAFDPYEAFLGLIRAWHRHDIDAVLSKLAEDIVWYPAVGSPPVQGRDGVRKVLEQFAPKRRQENWKVFHHAVNAERLFVEGVDDYVDDQGRRVAVPYAGVVEFRDGLITGWRDYFDVSTLNRIKAGEPIPEAIVPLISRPGAP